MWVMYRSVWDLDFDSRKKEWEDTPRRWKVTGRLTNTTTDKLQVYYGRAIRDNSHNIQAMKNALMAIRHHTQSTDKSSDHDLCPSGEGSWCGFQRDVAGGTQDYKHKHPLPNAVENTIRPTFEALSDTDLLQRCLHGGTQNQNEAFNALIWQRARKTTHSGLVVVELPTFLAISHFNDGTTTITMVLVEMGIKSGFHCFKANKKHDYSRLRHSQRKSTPAAKIGVNRFETGKREYTESLEAKEGQQYEAWYLLSLFFYP